MISLCTHTHTHTHTHRQAHPTTNRAQGSAEDREKNGESPHEPCSFDLAVRPCVGGRQQRESPLGVHAPYHRSLRHSLLDFCFWKDIHKWAEGGNERARSACTHTRLPPPPMPLTTRFFFWTDTLANEHINTAHIYRSA